jgi:Mrp family chromosome partitioning ATPase
VAPTAPFAPRPKRSGILGVAVGLFAGIGIAFLLEQLDTSIRTEDRLVGIMRQPILGRIPRVPKKALEHGVLLTVTDPASSAAESFRMLRSNLDFTQVDGDLSSVLVTSSVQGEGKSVTTCNLAVSLALTGKRIVVVDGDLRRPRVHAYFGLSNDVGVSTVAAGKTKLADALRTVQLRPDDEGPAADSAATVSVAADGSRIVPEVMVLPSGPLPPNPGEVVASERFAAIVTKLKEQADMVIVDSPAMLAVGDTAALASKVDGLVYLVDMRLMRRPLLQEAARRLGQVPCRKLGLVVIRHHQHSDYYRRHYYATDADEHAKQRPWPLRAKQK